MPPGKFKIVVFCLYGSIKLYIAFFYFIDRLYNIYRQKFKRHIKKSISGEFLIDVERVKIIDNAM